MNLGSSLPNRLERIWTRVHPGRQPWLQRMRQEPYGAPGLKEDGEDYALNQPQSITASSGLPIWVGVKEDVYAPKTKTTASNFGGSRQTN